LRRRRGATRCFHRSARFFFSAAGGFFLGARFFFHAARGFFGGRAHHQRLAFAFLTLALRFVPAVFFQHPLAHGEFRLGQRPARAGGAGGLATGALAATGTGARGRASDAARGRGCHRYAG
jgi:hypothetical protein